MPDPIEFLLIPFSIAASAALAVMILFWRRPNWGAPIALAAGALAPFYRIAGALPWFPPLDSKGWLFYLAILAALVALLLVVINPARWAWAIAVVVLVMIGSGAVLRHRLFDVDVQMPAILWSAGLIATALVWWIAFTSDESNQRNTTGAALFLLAIFCAARLLMSSAVLYGRLGVALSGAMAGIALIGLFRPAMRTISTLPVFVAFLTNLLLAGVFDADLDHVDMMAICLAPALFWGGKWATRRLKSRWVGITIQLSLLVLPLILVVTIRLPAFLRAMQVDTGGYGY